MSPVMKDGLQLRWLSLLRHQWLLTVGNPVVGTLLILSFCKDATIKIDRCKNKSRVICGDAGTFHLMVLKEAALKLRKRASADDGDGRNKGGISGGAKRFKS